MEKKHPLLLPTPQEIARKKALEQAIKLPWTKAEMLESGNCVRLLDDKGEVIGHVQVAIYVDDQETWQTLQNAVNNIILGNTKLVAKLLAQS